MENPDVQLDFIIKDEGNTEIASIQYKVYNREPKNCPTAEFVEMILGIFSRITQEDEKEDK